VNDKTTKPHEPEDRGHNQRSVGVVEHDSVPVDGVLVADRMGYSSNANGGQKLKSPTNMGLD
jgi:hypothetical protein